jgi:chromosome segregation ATPase
MTFTRILRVLTLFVTAVVLIVSLAGGVGVWAVWQPVTIRTTQTFGRVEGALQVVDGGLERARESLARATERLDAARQEQRDLSQQPQPKDARRKALALSVKRGIAPELEDAHVKLSRVAEASVVVNSVLEDVGQVPLLSAAGLDQERLAELNRRLAELGPAARELSQLLGEQGGDTDGVGEQFSRIDQTLRTVRAFLDEYQLEVRQVRERTAQLKDRVLSWITLAVVLLSAGGFWIALSQVILLRHAWAWGRGRPS